MIVLPQQQNPWVAMGQQRNANLMQLLQLAMQQQQMQRLNEIAKINQLVQLQTLGEKQRQWEEGQQPSPLGFLSKTTQEVPAPEKYSQMAMSEYGEAPTKKVETTEHMPINWERLKQLGPSLTELIKEGVIGARGGVPKGQPFTLGPGQTRFEGGKPIATGGPKEIKLQHVQEDKGDMYRRGTFNPDTGEEKWGEWQKKGITPGTEVNQELAKQRFGLNLRSQFNNLQPVKDFRDVNARIQIMNQAMEESKTAGNMVAIDQALITLFNKMTDPQSVVRESEYARTPQDLALMNRLKGKIQKVLKGGAGLTPDDRKAITKMGRNFYEVYKKVYRQYENEYRGYASLGQIDPNTVITPMPELFFPTLETGIPGVSNIRRE